MTRDEFKNCTELTDFCKTCLTNEFCGGARYMEIWEQSDSLSEFKYNVRQDKTLKLEQGTAELLKGDWYYLRDILGSNQFKTESDAGGVKIGNGDMSIIIPNGYGDGTTRVAILEPKEMNSSAFNFITAVEGTVNIYTYDCGSDIECTIKGRYGIYSKDGFVVFERWQ